MRPSTFGSLLLVVVVALVLQFASADVPGYDVIFVAGQSNAVGNGGPYVTWNQTTRIQMVVPWFSIVTAYDSTSSQGTNNTPGNNMNGFPIPVAQQHLAQNLDPNRNILIVNCAVPGTAFYTGFWAPGGTGPSTCAQYMTAAMAAGNGTNRLLMMLWLQGESDKGTLNSPQYARQLSLLIGYWRGGALPGASATTPFIAAPLANVCPISQPTCNFTIGGPYTVDLNPDTPAKLAIQRALMTLSYYQPYADCISNNGTLSDSTASHDGVHYGTSSLVLLGQRYYAMYLAIKANAGGTYSTTRSPAASIPNALGFYEFNQSAPLADSSPANFSAFCWSCNQYNASLASLQTNQLVYSASRSSWVYAAPSASTNLAVTPLLAFPWCQAANCTIAFWHQQSTVSAMLADYVFFSGAYPLNGGNYYPNVLFHASGTIIAGYTGASPYGSLPSGGIPASYITIDSAWHHFVFQYSVNGSTSSTGVLQVWQDGVNLGAPDYGWNFTGIPSVANFASQNSSITVGWWPLNPSSASFNAKYDDFAVFSRTLTNVEAMALYLHSTATLFVTPAPTSAPPTTVPSSAPSSTPTTSVPTSDPSSSPTSAPSSTPTTVAPTSAPSSTPTTLAPTSAPTSTPTTLAPTSAPTSTPTTLAPTSAPTATTTTAAPTSAPSSTTTTAAPTSTPSSTPTVSAAAPTTPAPTTTAAPTTTTTTGVPTTVAPTTHAPVASTTTTPTNQPSVTASTRPSSQPSASLSSEPSSQPSAEPSSEPTSSSSQALPSTTSSPTSSSLSVTDYLTNDGNTTIGIWAGAGAFLLLVVVCAAYCLRSSCSCCHQTVAYTHVPDTATPTQT